MDTEVFRAWIVSAAGVIEANRDHLTQLDAAIGDADHGINLARGFTAVLGALDAALAGVQQLGAAREGDKTMVDALAPATRAFSKAIADRAAPDDALSVLAEAASAGAAATVSMQALKGRASYLGPRSVGHEDPGAVSTALILGALRDAARAAGR